MTTVISTSIGSSSTASGTFPKYPDNGVVYLAVSGDANSTDLDISVTGAHPEHDATPIGTDFSSTVTAIDASSGDQLAKLTGLDGLREIAITVTNNAASATSVTVEHFK